MSSQAAAWTSHWRASQSPSPFAGIDREWLAALLAKHGWKGLECFSFHRSDENRVVSAASPDAKPALVVKLYRPGAWLFDALREEHEFLHELSAAGLPVVPPIDLGGHTVESRDGIFYALFPWIDGVERTGAEYTPSESQTVGELIAAMHLVGRLRPARHRRERSPLELAEGAVDYLLSSGVVQSDLRSDFVAAARAFIARLEALTRGCHRQRIHGDCGPWNVRWGREGPTVLDFDDMGPGLAIQDVALFCNDLAAGSAIEDEARVRSFLGGYCRRGELAAAVRSWFSPLRALRSLHVAAWCVSRRSEPGVARRHPDLDAEERWCRLVDELRSAAQRIQ